MKYIVTRADKWGCRSIISPHPMSKKRAKEFKQELEAEMQKNEKHYRWANSIKVERA